MQAVQNQRVGMEQPAAGDAHFSHGMQAVLINRVTKAKLNLLVNQRLKIRNSGWPHSENHAKQAH